MTTKELDGTWNSDISNNYINNKNQELNKYCKTLKRSDGGYVFDKSKPYGPAGCDKFALIRRPPTNTWFGRGCNLQKVIDDPDSAICDAWEKGYCSMNDIFLGVCNNDAPGGLADPRTDMDKYPNFDKFIKNGFVMDDCECKFNTQLKEMCVDDKKSYPLISSSGNNIRNIEMCISKSCDPLSDYNTPYSTYGNNKMDLAGEVWETEEDPNCSIITADYKSDSLNIKSNCSKYIEKWAKTCKWCEKYKDNIIAPDYLNICKGDSDCYSGKCSFLDAESISKLPEKLQPLARAIGNCTVTNDYIKECKICDSKLWEQVPGGVDAVVDANHPLHDIATFSYVSKPQLLERKQRSLYGMDSDIEYGYQPGNILVDTALGGWATDVYYPGKDDPDVSETTVCDVGPYRINYYTAGSDEYICNPQRKTTDIKAYTSMPWGIYTAKRDPVNNPNYGCGSVCNSASPIAWLGEPVDGTNPSVWQTIGSNSEINSRDKCSVTNNFYSGSFDVSHDKKPLQMRLMCQRNPQLTGQGLYDIANDKPTKSNYHIAMNWATGYLDLSDYGIPKKKYFDDKETRKHLLETLRCCNSVPPDKTKTLEDCMPATTCPSNKFCRDIHAAIPGLPDYDSYSFGHATEWDPKTSTNPADYLKMYCEYMKDDPDVAKFCRKTMYNYASQPVSVVANTDEYRKDTYELPLRIFDDSVVAWCKGKGLEDSLPDQMGMCDILLGTACQQLQVDGWIDPKNFSDSKLLSTFSKDGKWVTTNGESHTGLTGQRIRDVCGCFLLGAQCGSRDCSYSYCGAGPDCNGITNKDQCESEGCKWDTSGGMCTSPINTEVTIGDKSLPKWSSNLNDDGTCPKGNCYQGCNYVNTYDVCWNANQRKISNDTTWNTNGTNVKGDFACAGGCPIDSVGEPNCGTNTWFGIGDCAEQNTQSDCESKIQCKWSNGTCTSLLKDLVPNEGPMRREGGNQYVAGWDRWQNYYLQSIADQQNGVSIPGMGFSLLGSSNDARCKFGDCGANVTGIKPYNNDLSCTSSCSVKQVQNVNNQGDIFGSITMSNNSALECNITFDTNLIAADQEIRRSYINYMGNINNCIENCDDSKVCINVSNGDNCSDCTSKDLGAKSNFCCISESVIPTTGTQICYPRNPLNKSDTSLCTKITTSDGCYKERALCKWGTNEQYQNTKIVQTVGSKVSYICQEGCPLGSVDLTDLQRDNCTKNCNEYTTETDCGTCKYCKWNRAKSTCVAVCPMQGPDVVVNKTEKQEPTPSPTPTPTTPAPEPTPVNIGLIVGCSVGGLVLILVILWVVFFKKKT